MKESVSAARVPGEYHLTFPSRWLRLICEVLIAAPSSRESTVTSKTKKKIVPSKAVVAQGVEDWAGERSRAGTD